jgi:hypothetical protein
MSIKYWEGKVAKWKRKNARWNESISPYFSVNLTHANNGAYVCLLTDNKYNATQKEKDACVLLKAKRWAAMWEVCKARKSKKRSE